MNKEVLQARQKPLKERYREHPAASVVKMSARGTLQPDEFTCRVSTDSGDAVSGLHPAAGGDDGSICSGDMLLQSLVACAGVTLNAVATAMGIPLAGGTIVAEGDLDFRGTLAVSKDVPVGFTRIVLKFELEADADDKQVAKLVELTERYCVIAQTLRSPVEIETVHSHEP